MRLFTLRMMFLAALAFSFLFAISSLPDPISSDKLLHVLVFAALAGLGWFAFPRLSTLQLALALSIFGATIELTQAIPMVSGSPQFKDWVADNIGLVLMLAFLWSVQRIFVQTKPDA